MSEPLVSDGGSPSAATDAVLRAIEAHASRSASIGELQAAAVGIDERIGELRRAGASVEALCALAGSANRRVIERLWTLVAPPALAADSCLLVMGSQGRGEQILKTDQDNALLLRDGADHATPELLDAVARRFNAALVASGYPPCPGDVMLTNPRWRLPLRGLRRTIRGWLEGEDGHGAIHLAVFLDAAAVAGDAGLLRSAREVLDAMLAADDALLARFARPAETFDDPGPWWARLAGRRDELPLDLKKAGIFPIVHGVRALALESRAHDAGTAARLRALVAGGRLGAGFAHELLAALHCLMGLRLDAQLRRRARGEPPGDALLPCALDSAERDQLHASLAVVKRLRLHLHLHFRLDTL